MWTALMLSVDDVCGMCRGQQTHKRPSPSFGPRSRVEVRRVEVWTPPRELRSLQTPPRTPPRIHLRRVEVRRVEVWTPPHELRSTQSPSLTPLRRCHLPEAKGRRHVRGRTSQAHHLCHLQALHLRSRSPANGAIASVRRRIQRLQMQD